MLGHPLSGRRCGFGLICPPERIPASHQLVSLPATDNQTVAHVRVSLTQLDGVHEARDLLLDSGQRHIDLLRLVGPCRPALFPGGTSGVQHFLVPGRISDNATPITPSRSCSAKSRLSLVRMGQAPDRYPRQAKYMPCAPLTVNVELHTLHRTKPWSKCRGRCESFVEPLRRPFSRRCAATFASFSSSSPCAAKNVSSTTRRRCGRSRSYFAASAGDRSSWQIWPVNGFRTFVIRPHGQMPMYFRFRRSLTTYCWRHSAVVARWSFGAFDRVSSRVIQPNARRSTTNQ